MPITTRDKRASVLLYDLPFSRVWTNPDNNIANTNDRTHLAYKYASLVVSASGAAGTRYYLLPMLGVG